MIGEIVGARSTLDNNFYRGRVLKRIDDDSYLIHYIDFGDKDNVPKSNIYDIPKDFMVFIIVIDFIFYIIVYIYMIHYLFIDTFKYN